MSKTRTFDQERAASDAKSRPWPAPGYSLQTKIMFSIGLTILMSVGISTILYTRNFSANYLEAIQWRSVTLAQRISVEINRRYELFGEVSNSRLILEASYLQCRRLYDANKDMHVSFVAVLDKTGTVVTHNDKSLWNTTFAFADQRVQQRLEQNQTITVLLDDNYHTLIPMLMKDGVYLGAIDVGFPQAIVQHKIAANIKRAFVTFSLLFVAMFLVLWLFIKRLVSRPVDRLMAATADIARGDLERKIDGGRSREFWKLAQSLTHMRDAIRTNIAEIHQKNEEIKALTACSPVALFSIDLEHRVVTWTESAERLFGWSVAEAVGQPLPTVPDAAKQQFADICREVQTGTIAFGREIGQQRKDGTLFPASLSSAPIRDADQTIIGIMGALEDISERVERENAHRDIQQQLHQSQKLESVGRLAGGIAHDYNNMLGVILGYAELLRDEISPSGPHLDYIQQIIGAADHSKEITQQLLAFARKQTIAPEIISVNDKIQKLMKMLGRLLGEDVKIIWAPKPETAQVKMDPTQIDQILVNLCINARDAMPSGGEITIESTSLNISDSYCQNHPEFLPGHYVRLSISDNGAGMDKDIREKIFEPFFTTKELGKGTGLGLATVYGIVKQNNGFLNVYSEPGKGTTFNIYIPEYEASGRLKPLVETPPPVLGAGELVLIAEDEPAILKMCEKMLTSLGYEVLLAQSATEALLLVEQNREQLKLLVSDVILPDMNGRELSEQVQRTCPGLKTLYMSGYTANVIAHRGVLDDGIHFIQKPFSKQAFGEKIRVCLDDGTGKPG